MANTIPSPGTIPFKLIPLEDVPSRPPITKPVTYRRGSQWDPLLDALLKNKRNAAKVHEPDALTRNRLKSTLQTIAKNRAMSVEILADREDIYAWLGSREGRYAGPMR
jgi:hypothetical protein